MKRFFAQWLNSRNRICFPLASVVNRSLLFLFAFLFCFHFFVLGQQRDSPDSLNCSPAFKIVVLGSSTSFGTGAVPIDSSYVNRYKFYAQGRNAQHTIINLATLSLTTYHVLCPTGFIPPPGRPTPDINRNITKALSFQPDAIIINLPSNDIALGIPQQESKDNYERTMHLIDSVNIPVWVSTTQPRNTLSPQERIYLMEFRDWTYQRFGNKTLDFWTDVANPDGTINTFYSFGDGVHVNNNGHNLFYTRTRDKHILDTLCLRQPAVLPLRLLSFTTQKHRQGILLSWETESETDLASFSVEKSTASGQWQVLRQVPAFNTPGRHQYSCTDDHPAGGIIFYRLKQIDQNGTFSYSRVSKVDMTKKPSLQFSYYPATREVLVRSDQPVSGMMLLDMNGRVIMEFGPVSGNRFRLNNVAPGLYLLKAQVGGYSQSNKLLIQ